MIKKICSVLLIIIMLTSFSAGAVRAEEKLIRLSLDDVTKLALQNNFDIQLAKYDAWIKQTDDMKSQSIFDTMLDAEVRYRENERAQTTTLAGTNTTENDYNIGVVKKLPTGTSISLDLTNERESTNSMFTSAPLTHDSTLELEIVQELGRNFFGMLDRGRIEITLIQIENARYTSLDKIEQSIANVQQAYWDLVLQAERVEIERDMVEQAKKLYDLHQKQLEDGLVEIPDAIASEANYEQSKNRLILARNTFKRKLNVLKLLLNRSDVEGIVEPIDVLDIPDDQIVTMDSLDKAFKNRRDYKLVMNDIEASDILLSKNKNELLPEINLMVSLARNGLGDHFDDALENIVDENNPNFFAGITFSIPLENRQARAELKAAELQKARTLIGAKSLERKISIEIVDQVRDCNIFAELAKNEEMIANLQIKKLEEELKRFNRGRSNTDTIIRFQEDVIRARLQAAEAKFRYQISLIDLQRKEATLLSRYWDESL